MRRLLVIAGVLLAAVSCTASGPSYNGWIPVGQGPQSFEEQHWACTNVSTEVTLAIVGYTDPDFVGEGLSVRISKDIAPRGSRTPGAQVLVERHFAGAGEYVTSSKLDPGDCFLIEFEVPGECVELNPPATFPPCKRFSTPGVTYRVQW
jgi:hypothetical protein